MGEREIVILITRLVTEREDGLKFKIMKLEVGIFRAMVLGAESTKYTCKHVEVGESRY